MPKKIKIKIPVIVGSNGKWCANGYDSLKNPAEDADWSFMSDNLDGSAIGEKEPVWPAAEARFIVEAEVDVPDEISQTVSASSVEALTA